MRMVVGFFNQRKSAKPGHNAILLVHRSDIDSLFEGYNSDNYLQCMAGGSVEGK